MSEDSIETKLARLEGRFEGRIKHLETVANDHQETLYGTGDHKGGLVNEMKDVKTENKYLRLIYVLVTALVLPWLNALLGRMGLGPLRIG